VESEIFTRYQHYIPSSSFLRPSALSFFLRHLHGKEVVVT